MVRLFEQVINFVSYDADREFYAKVFPDSVEKKDILRIRSVSVRRELWNQQSRMSRLTSPAAVRRRAERLALDLAEPGSEQPVRLVHNER